jgi:hypothetical protein
VRGLKHGARVAVPHYRALSKSGSPSKSARSARGDNDPDPDPDFDPDFDRCDSSVWRAASLADN